MGQIQEGPQRKMKLTLTNIIKIAREKHDYVVRYARDLCRAAVECGEALQVIKKMVPHGDYEETVRSIGISERTARKYVQCAEAKAIIGAKKFNWLLDNGAALADLLRADEIACIKPLPMAGYDAEKYEQRKALAQLEMAFSYDESLSAVRSIHKAKLSELSERSLKVLLRDTEEAKARLETEISSRTGRVIDLDDSTTNNNPEDKQP
jgi:hypothetical protein